MTATWSFLSILEVCHWSKVDRALVHHLRTLHLALALESESNLLRDSSAHTPSCPGRALKRKTGPIFATRTVAKMNAQAPPAKKLLAISPALGRSVERSNLNGLDCSWLLTAGTLEDKSK
jgi:hypothetical protein